MVYIIVITVAAFLLLSSLAEAFSSPRLPSTPSAVIVSHVGWRTGIDDIRGRFGPPNSVQLLIGNNYEPSEIPTAGRLEELKQEETKLASMLASVRREKLAVLRGKFSHDIFLL